MTVDFKPMLAATYDGKMELAWPMLASPKLDGIRALVRGGVLYSRNIKPIPNKFLQARFGRSKYNGLDGELICGDPTMSDCFNTTQSVVMSEQHTFEDHVTFHVFDDFKDKRLQYFDRMQEVRRRLFDENDSIMKQVPHITVLDESQAEEHELKCLDLGYEGMMLRSFTGLYKYGRATPREATLLKVKRFADAEAIIVDIEPLYRNNNTQTKDELGRSKRSTHKDNLVALPMVGNMQVLGDGGKWDKVQFGVGSGFTEEQRQRFWVQRKSLLGARITYKYFESGSKDAPRFPVFKAFRPEGA